jgi:IstB-like ATP binding protein
MRAWVASGGREDCSKRHNSVWHLTPMLKVRERLEALLQDATTQETPYADFLDLVLTEEVASKTAKHVTMRTRLARFPFVKSLETFDFSYQPSLDKKQIQTLATCHFIERLGSVLDFIGARIQRVVAWEEMTWRRPSLFNAPPGIESGWLISSSRTSHRRVAVRRLSSSCARQERCCRRATRNDEG